MAARMRLQTAVADGLSAHGDVTVVNVATLDPESVAGVQASRCRRADACPRDESSIDSDAAMETAAKNDDLQAEPDADGLGLREWFKQLPPADGQLGAAFDTRLNKPIAITGSAAKVIGKQLRKHRYSLLTDPRASSSRVPRGHCRPARSNGPADGERTRGPHHHELRAG